MLLWNRIRSHTLGFNKGTKINDIMNECRVPREEGSEPHITIMVVIPGKYKDALSTLNVAKTDAKGWAVTHSQLLLFLTQECYVLSFKMTGSYLTLRTMSFDRKNLYENPDMSPNEVMEACDDIQGILTPQYLLKQLIRMLIKGC
jgi:hypothetical protein